MFLDQGTWGEVNKNSEKNLRLFKNGHFAMNSIFTAVAGIKVTVVLQRIYLFFNWEEENWKACFYNVMSDWDDKTSRSIEDSQQKKFNKYLNTRRRPQLWDLKASVWSFCKSMERQLGHNAQCISNHNPF